MRVLIFGGAGMLGYDLLRSSPPDATIHAPDVDEIDISRPAAVTEVLDRCRPDWVVNAAAFTAVDRAEAEASIAFAVNGEAVRSIGDECSRRGVRVLHFSTDYVFPGTGSRPYLETDPVLPVNTYGRSKLVGENALLASRAQALIIRTQWLFGPGGRSFPRTMWAHARARTPTHVVNDQIGRPTYTRDLAIAAWQLLRMRVTGILHVTNGGPSVSWFELAREVFRRVGSESLLSPCSSVDYPTLARRPPYSVLDTSRFESIIPGGLPPWTDALSRFLADLERSDEDAGKASHGAGARDDTAEASPSRTTDAEAAPSSLARRRRLND